MYFKVSITETGRNTLKDEPHTFNNVIETFRTIEGAKQFLIDRYGTIPKRNRNNTLFRDVKDNKGWVEAKESGFTTSYWNKDISHNSTSWYQTDWVEVTQVEEKTILVN
jgi:hypothetical protein